jgi:hypothetical protein
MSLSYRQRKKTSGVIAGERGGHGIGPSRPNLRQGKCMSGNSQTIWVQCWGYNFIFLKQFYFIVFGLKIVGHGIPDNNLESHCTLVIFHICYFRFHNEWTPSQSIADRILVGKSLTVHFYEYFHLLCTMSIRINWSMLLYASGLIHSLSILLIICCAII